MAGVSQHVPAFIDPSMIIQSNRLQLLHYFNGNQYVLDKDGKVKGIVHSKSKAASPKLARPENRATFYYCFFLLTLLAAWILFRTEKPKSPTKM
jgi:hypothetical protein